jgi:hypothetical protein
MFVHFLHLAARSWLALMSATSTNTLGFLVWSLLVVVLGWFITALSAWSNLRKQEGGWGAIAPALRTSLKGGGVGVSIIVALAVVMWAIFLVRTVYDDHMQLIAQRASDLRRTTQLERDLQVHRHSVSTSDPVFPNLIYMLQAFAVFRGEVHGESCVVRITAPAMSQPLASLFAQFSVSTSNCATFGPDAPLNTNPDLESEALDGMVPDAIVFHAQREDKAANELFMRLYNQIKLVRSYKMPNAADYQGPAGGYVHTVWLQFGSQVNWNSELVQPTPQIPKGGNVTRP